MKRLALVMALVLTGAVRAEPNCWARSVLEPVANDGLPITHASFKPLHAAMDQIEQFELAHGQHVVEHAGVYGRGGGMVEVDGRHDASGSVASASSRLSAPARAEIVKTRGYSRS